MFLIYTLTVTIYFPDDGTQVLGHKLAALGLQSAMFWAAAVVLARWV